MDMEAEAGLNALFGTPKKPRPPSKEELREMEMAEDLEKMNEILDSMKNCVDEFGIHLKERFIAYENEYKDDIYSIYGMDEEDIWRFLEKLPNWERCDNTPFCSTEITYYGDLETFCRVYSEHFNYIKEKVGKMLRDYIYDYPNEFFIELVESSALKSGSLLFFTTDYDGKQTVFMEIYPLYLKTSEVHDYWWCGDVFLDILPEDTFENLYIVDVSTEHEVIESFIIRATPDEIEESKRISRPLKKLRELVVFRNE